MLLEHTSYSFYPVTHPMQISILVFNAFASIPCCLQHTQHLQRHNEPMGREEKERNTSLSLQHSSRGRLGERLTTMGFAQCLLTKSRSRTEAASCPRSHRSYLRRQWRLGCCGRSEFNKARHNPLNAIKVTLIFKPSLLLVW